MQHTSGKLPLTRSSQLSPPASVHTRVLSAWPLITHAVSE